MVRATSSGRPIRRIGTAAIIISPHLVHRFAADPGVPVQQRRLDGAGADHVHFDPFVDELPCNNLERSIEPRFGGAYVVLPDT